MQQPSLFIPQSLSVSEITRYLHDLMESDEILSDVWVQGEIATLSRPASGHIYFTLKDASSTLRCVIWRTSAGRLPVVLQSGMQIEAHGYINVYERDGQYQLYVDTVRLAGEGALYQEFLRLKAKLEAEGLFDAERKRSLPQIPKAIGIVTSPTGAALQDILNVLRRRFPLVEVTLAPCSVQGDAAPAEIVSALQKLNEQARVDVILVARGGGSMEDLWAFNDERVVRAIAASAIPVIAGIGHEIDFTLSDFAADLRAPTPTAAAELAVPDREELKGILDAVTSRMIYASQSSLGTARSGLTQLLHRVERASPLWMVRNDLQRLDDLTSRLETGMGSDFRFKRAEWQGLSRRLIALNPFAVLQRGYAIVTNTEGKVVSSVKQVSREEVLDVKLSDGVILTRVLSAPGNEIEGEKT
jgi:exodeoxyribonuclease VII large subunit